MCLHDSVRTQYFQSTEFTLEFSLLRSETHKENMSVQILLHLLRLQVELIHISECPMRSNVLQNLSTEQHYKIA